MTQRRRGERGFTFIELVVVLAIIALLAAIAYPSYMGQVRKSRRSDAQVALLNIAQVFERCYTELNVYNNTACAATGARAAAPFAKRIAQDFPALPEFL